MHLTSSPSSLLPWVICDDPGIPAPGVYQTDKNIYGITSTVVSAALTFLAP